MLKTVVKFLLIPSAIFLLISSGCNRNKLLVEVTPSTANVEIGQSRQFTAKVKPHNAVVIWSVDEGDAWGTISESGLYTAPALTPSPSIATVRATLVADSTVTDTAQVTIVSDIDTTSTSTIPGNTTTTTTTGGQLPNEPTIYLMTFNIGFDLAQFGSDVTEMAVETVWKASALNGGYETLTGTLTQNGDNYNYSPQPADKLVLALSNGTSYEFKFSKFDGFKNGDAQAFFYSHDIDFTAKSAAMDIHILSYSPYQNDHTELNRRTIGTCIYDSYQTNIDITHTGTLQNTVDMDWAEQIYNTQCTGTATASFGSFTVSEQYYHHYIHQSDAALAVWERKRMSNSGVNINGTTYQYQNAYVHWISSSSFYDHNNEPNSQWYGAVEDGYQWEASGGVLKNGQSAGQTQFDRAVVNGTYGPYFILKLNNSSTIVLHKLLNLQ